MLENQRYAGDFRVLADEYEYGVISPENMFYKLMDL